MSADRLEDLDNHVRTALAKKDFKLAVYNLDHGMSRASLRYLARASSRLCLAAVDGAGAPVRTRVHVLRGPSALAIAPASPSLRMVKAEALLGAGKFADVSALAVCVCACACATWWLRWAAACSRTTS